MVCCPKKGGAKWIEGVREKHLRPYFAAGGPRKPPAGTKDFWVLRDVEDVMKDDMPNDPKQAVVTFKGEG